ncbi:DUF1566 domain-containing protein, partial [Thermodesulfobacteriota bacterium]
MARKIFLIVSFLVILNTSRVYSVTYQLVDLGTLGGSDSYAFGINNNGQVVGISDTGTGRNAFLWDILNGMQLINDIGQINTDVPLKINDNGQICGTYVDMEAGGFSTAFIWDNYNGLQHLGSLGGNQSQAWSINNKGQVVGYSYTGANSHAFIWDNENGMLDLNLGVNYSSATDINDDSEVVGSYGHSSGYQHSFIWDNFNGMRDIGGLGGNVSSAYSINNKGEVVGASWTSGTSISHAYIWDIENGMRDIGTLGDYSSLARSINNHSRVIGSSHVSAVKEHGFIWNNIDGISDLQYLIDKQSEYEIMRVFDINDSGQIVGYARVLQTWDVHAIVLNPVNDPPVAYNQNVVTDEDTSASITLIGSDNDGDFLTYTIVDSPSNGTLVGTVPHLTYVPDENFNGVDIFSFKAHDGFAYGNIAVVNIAIYPIDDPFIVPSSPSPQNGSKNISFDTILSWLSGDPDEEDDVVYDIYFGTTPSPPLLVSNHNLTNITLATLEYNTTYYWKIVAKDNSGTEYIGPIWNFTSDVDSDLDGMLDGWELSHFGNLGKDGTDDSDSDGLLDYQEYQLNTDPTNSDSDSDGMIDGWEVNYELNPNLNDALIDADGDKFTNGREHQDQTDPNDNSSHLIFPEVTGRIPDTGQTTSYTDTYGEDSDYIINPPSFIKMDSQGNYIVDSATSWAMVRDNITGLIWEVKTDDGSIHDKDDKYTWCDNNPDTNGGNAGTCDNGTDTEDFINVLNAENFGGFSDWRLPTREELRSIVDYGRYIPAISTDYFPNTVASNYWSSTTFASNIYYAWHVYFYNGYDNYSYGKSYSYYVRAVRGGQSGSLGNLVINGDETVTDNTTGLMWQRVTAANTMNWQSALSYCEALDLGGYTDWRLPNIKELFLLPDLNRYGPAIDTDYFPDTVASNYWSSTTNAYYTNDAWHVNFDNGNGHDSYKSYSYSVRAVRGGQIVDTDSDGMPDNWETHYFTDLSHDGTADGDSDNLTDLEEYQNSTDPNDSDSDDDAMPDSWEVMNSLNPSLNDSGDDADGDKFTNGREYQDQTDPHDSSSYLIFPQVTGRIPDTGQTASYTDTLGEDSDYLINAPAYIKLNAQGNYLPDNATDWMMVWDNVTGLIWEVKQAKDGVADYANPHDADNRHTWYDSNPETNGGNAGAPGGGTDTEDFIAALNATNFGGYLDWRLPSREELRSIVDYSRSNPSIETAFFPNTVTIYWSSTTYASSTSRAWGVRFGSGGGGDNGDDKSNSFYVRAVRGGQSGSLGNLVINGDGTVTDTATGLMWQQDTAPGSYTLNFSALNYPGGLNTVPTGIHNNKIVGYYNTYNQAFLYDGAAWTNLSDYLEINYSSRANGIDGDHIVGSYWDGTASHGYLYDGYSWKTLDYPGAIQTYPNDLDGGKIVGHYWDANGCHGFLYDGVNWISLDYPGDGNYGTGANGIDGNKIVGSYRDINGHSHGFLYDGVNWISLDYPGAISSYANSIENDTIVGEYDTESGTDGSFLYNDSKWTALDYPGAITTRANDLNDGKIVGEYFDGSQFHGFIAILVPESSPIIWHDALSYCQSLTLAGHTDWRLPTIKELASLADLSRYDPAIDTAFFPNTVSNFYWSSATYDSSTDRAWHMYLNYGDVLQYNKSNSNYVRAVRGGQSLIDGNLFITAPSQASTWIIGDPMSIFWATQDIQDNVSISISRDGGKTYESITNSTENDGNYDWTITGPASVNCMLKIEPLNYPSKVTIQGLFTIANQPPIADEQSVSTDEDVPVNITLTGTDPNGDPLTYSITDQPTYGTLSGTPPNVTYEPFENYNGNDTFSFIANDGTVDSDVATVSIAINPVNDFPAATDSFLFADEDQSVEIILSGGDIDGDALSYFVVDSPMHGALSGTAPNLTYVPNADYNGGDSFTFKANDGLVDSAAATVSLTVNPVNDPPTTNDQNISLDEDTTHGVTLTGTDIEADALTYSVMDGPLHGSLSGDAPDLIYTPDLHYNGDDSFTFKANDGNLDSGISTVLLTRQQNKLIMRHKRFWDV